jgi:hypothetical protein
VAKLQRALAQKEEELAETGCDLEDLHRQLTDVTRDVDAMETAWLLCSGVSDSLIPMTYAQTPVHDLRQSIMSQEDFYVYTCQEYH